MKVSAHPSELALDRGGEAVEAHVRECASCRARAEEASAARADFAARVYPATWPAVRARRARVRRFPAWVSWWPIGAVAAVTSVALVFGVVKRSTVEEPTIEFVEEIDGTPTPIPPERFPERGREFRIRLRLSAPQYVAVYLQREGGRRHRFSPATGAVRRVVSGELIAERIHLPVTNNDPQTMIIVLSDHPFPPDEPPPSARVLKREFPAAP